MRIIPNIPFVVAANLMYSVGQDRASGAQFVK